MNNIEEFYKSHGKKVYFFLLSFVHNEDLAQDLTQETFFQAMKTINNYRGDCKPSVWLCQIAKHIWYKYLKDNNKVECISIEQIYKNIPDSYDIDSQIIRKEDKIEFYKKLQKLDTSMKEVVYLRISSDLSFAEIGEIMGQSENWARVTFYRAKKKLMEAIYK
ncbi:RNA polymerase sigma factor [Candidatus Galacturonibacter soehngenii]|uniref:Sigma-70 family RNA polymerase sigma factor n=1 Tax=Candidatus Galacturonatibacter soehngenii TaxID=2307010 RepID=A0A7V7QMJ8_9FIRM|nr:sigma-70 family RNA polymerase sigma factor [Candidatus Galacturonibacter soehngenii]KAB1439778.1 sigma-70 family RNA polymerase sigma factor [Candidatus Galacturonibacter soehngenii]